ncbi:hypothetical protein L6164_001822 [Bauhinia variegata]|uniref:Uncharacterized protein n=1 Tax=Bauhinia variegata TaxID=167791 RepID=A0ACB9QI56_BAUVA|nr:hypothetical protein L6164_001822 [Bauhinia variegata]
MYVTRPLSMYKKDPSALSLPTPEGPNSGYLVIFDEEAQTYCCFGLCKDSKIGHLPFPQNKNLSIEYTVYADKVCTNKVMLIPVLNKPLSANRYYVIGRGTNNVGEAMTSSKKGDWTCAHCGQWRVVNSRPFDPFNVYQQFKMIKSGSRFSAKSIAPDGFPPAFLSKGWSVTSKTPKHYHLEEASGLNSSLRARLPDFNFPLSDDHYKPVVVGKWYCPFIFVKEKMEPKEQMEMSAFYEMTLEQKWEKIFSKENSETGESSVLVDVIVQKKVARLAGRDAAWDEGEVADGELWFKSVDGVGEELSVGLSMAVVERMKWEQERVPGWGGREKRQERKKREVRIKKVEEFAGGSDNGWERFGCYVLVETFVLKRMDGSLVLSYDYKHIHQLRCRWE